jgi:moderate conductance mechanosensitive channel
MNMTRLLILACLGFVIALGARAQAPAQTTPPQTQTATPAITPAQARQAIDALQDPQKRSQITAILETIARAEPQPAPAPAPPPAPSKPASEPAVTVAPNSLGAEVLFGASHFLSHASTEAIDTVSAIRSVPLLWNWVHMMATDPGARGVLLDVGWRVALALVAGLVVEWAIRRSVRRPILAVARRAPNGEPHSAELSEAEPSDEDGEALAESGEIEPPRRRVTAALTLLRRLPLVGLRLLLELLPVFGFLAVGHLIAATSLAGNSVPRLVMLAVVDSYALCAAILAAARILFSPSHRRLRLLTVSDDTAAYAMRWIRRIVIVTVVGYAGAEVGLLLGLTYTAHGALLKTISLIDHVFLGIIVIQRRRTVRRWLRAPEGATGMIAAIRNWFARIWHWIALLILASLWLAWVVEVPNGYQVMFRSTVALIVVAIVARLVQIAMLGALDRALAPRPELADRFPGLDARLALYHPVLISVVRALVFLAAAVTLLQLWGLGTFDWLVTSRLGQHLLSSLITIAVTALLSIAVWEASNAAIQRHLARLTREAQIARSARLRTLLPLLRTTLLITLLIVAGMMVLSEIGVNIGPLLAGAGIVGVAIGFGSQKLVQDLITGIFLLLENAMQVGDSVTVSGLSGTVENLSVRTIRLRAGDGSVHIIPFSSVTSVTNVNRGLGNASVSVSIAWHEDTDRVSDTLKEIVSDMQKEPTFAKQMLSDLQLWGVDKVDGASVTISGQVVCTDSGRWSVQREFNRRMKKRFEDLGIELYNPMQQTVSVRRMIEDQKS